MTTSDLRDVTFTFLTSGPCMRVSLPAHFHELPEATAPIVSGIGARSFVFMPEEGSDEVVAAGNLIESLAGRDRRVVEVYERVARPLTWWLRWRLSNGAIITHLREEDGLERAADIAGAVTILEGSCGGAPMVLGDPPLKSAVSTKLGYQEENLHRSILSPHVEVSFRRPGFLEPGKVVRLAPEASNGHEVVRAGLEFGIEVCVTSDSLAVEADQIVANILDTIGEVVSS